MEAEIPKIVIKNKPRILILVPFNIYPPINGGKRRLFYLYKELSNKYKITVLSLSGENKKIFLSEDFEEIQVARTSDFYKYLKKIEDELKIPAEDIAAVEGFKYIPDFIELYRKLFDKADIVVFYHPYLINLLDLTRYTGKKLIIYEAPDVEFLQKKGNNLKKEYLQLIRNIEFKAISLSNLVISVSTEDKNKFKKIYKVPDNKVFVIENGINLEEIDPVLPDEKAIFKKACGLQLKPVFTFVGSYHPPNVKAIKYILEWAKIFKDVYFFIIGSVGYALKGKKLPSNIKNWNIVSEQEKDFLLKAGDVGLNPIISGAGSNLKLLEYLAYGLPVITTPFGKRGFNLHIPLIESPLEYFPYFINQIKGDIEILQLILINMREKLEKYSWSNIAKRYMEILQNYLANK